MNTAGISGRSTGPVCPICANILAAGPPCLTPDAPSSGLPPPRYRANRNRYPVITVQQRKCTIKLDVRLCTARRTVRELQQRCCEPELFDPGFLASIIRRRPDCTTCAACRPPVIRASHFYAATIMSNKTESNHGRSQNRNSWILPDGRRQKRRQHG